jgi:hypothetical protein
MTKIIHNVETGQTEVVPLSESDIALGQSIQDELEARQAAKDQAQAKLLALGLSIDDLKALGL